MRHDYAIKQRTSIVHRNNLLGESADPVINVGRE